MKKLIPALAIFSLLAPTLTFAAGRFEEKDFQWDSFSSLYKRVVVAGVNKVAREHPAECTKLDPAAVGHYGGTPDDPEFVVYCGDPDHLLHFYFTKADITGDPGSNIPKKELEQ